MAKPKEILTIVPLAVSIIVMFIPFMFNCSEYYYGEWETYYRFSYFQISSYSPCFIIAVIITIIVIVSQILKLVKVNMPILYNDKFFLITIAPLAWFVISGIIRMVQISSLWGDGYRVTPFILFFVEIIILAVPLVINLIPGLFPEETVETVTAAGTGAMEASATTEEYSNRIEPEWPVEEPAAPAQVAPAELDEEKIAALKEFKSLYDEGILTAEEFDSMRKNILGL